MAENQAKNAWDDQDTPKAEKVSDIWEEFAENSSLHGLKNAVLSRSVYLRIAWWLVVLAAFSFLFYSIFQSCKRYFEYPTTFQVTQKNNDTLIFPAVTICSKSTADKTKLSALDTDKAFYDYGLNISACAATAEVRAGIACGYALLCACVTVTLTSAPPVAGCNESLQLKILDALESHHVEFNTDEFFKTFYQSWDEMVHWCSYGTHGQNCSASFKPLIKGQGLCFTFNSNKTNANFSNYPGPQGGLQIVLNTQIDRFYYPKSFSDGFSVYVNDQKDFINEIGINAGPGFLTSILLEMKKVKYLQHPYGAQCGERTLNGVPQYSAGACYGQCWSDYFYKTCGCRPVGYGVFGDAIPCYSIYANCTQAAMALFKFSMCDCPVDCEVTTYGTEVSYGTLPDKSTKGVKEIFYSSNYSREKYAVIEIGFKQISFTQREETFTFGKTSLFGEVGGNMGLLLGCSILTLVEFIELIFSFLMLRLKRNNIGAQ